MRSRVAGDPHSGATVHDAEVKQVVADAQGQFLAAGMVGGYQQRVLACCPTSVMKAPTRAGRLHSGKAPRVTRPGPSYTREHPVSVSPH